LYKKDFPRTDFILPSLIGVRILNVGVNVIYKTWEQKSKNKNPLNYHNRKCIYDCIINVWDRMNIGLQKLTEKTQIATFEK